VVCDETIEHVGERAAQAVLISELWRIARRGVFLTAYNAGHPFESVKGLPLLGRVAPSGWAAVPDRQGKPAVSRLLDRAALESITASLPGAPTPSIGHIRVCGVKARYFVMLRKSA
jgi:hypothetical protein